ncbi:hypothetical protein [Streptomyces scopuliridis]|uniref:Uncharacterized protein n=1 Tax=Streptomyces scopuliridis RB72 TaxID=1440053 RepID=A0A2T7TDU4_9ACTN|nr:hypothetical protein [Streptomyces scopuliridis]PVE13268.1 hypothetical protein Y717_20540 [Streptomyces scopuliridis RB72]
MNDRRAARNSSPLARIGPAERFPGAPVHEEVPAFLERVRDEGRLPKTAAALGRRPQRRDRARPRPGLDAENRRVWMHGSTKTDPR